MKCNNYGSQEKGRGSSSLRKRNVEEPSCALGSIGDPGPQSLLTFLIEVARCLRTTVCAHTQVFPFSNFWRQQALSLNLKLTDCLEQLPASLGILFLPRIAETSHCINFWIFKALLTYLGACVWVCQCHSAWVCEGQGTSLGTDSLSVMWTVWLCGKCLCLLHCPAGSSTIFLCGCWRPEVGPSC